LNTPVPAATTATSVRGRLAEVADGDTEFAIELLTAFMDGAIESLQEMRTAARSPDLPALARAAHKLKGASANLHVEELATLTESLEIRAKAGVASDWPGEVERVADEYARISTDLRELLEEAGWQNARSA
jgi:HPt (histidine-containing phosphotransfer) domain-containing protein